VTYNINMTIKFETRTLGPIAAKFINEFLQEGKSIFSLEEAAIVYKQNKSKTSSFLKNLVNRGVLARIKSGSYLILQMGQENVQLSNWPVIARELAKPHAYFISHFSAMRMHGMSTHPLLDIYITLTNRQRNRKFYNIQYHFIYAKPKHFWGAIDLWISKHEKVMVSDLERTILDGLERPDLCGGIKEVTKGIWTKINEVNWDKLRHYIKKYKTIAAIKRLGYILELLNIGSEHINFIQKIIASANGYILLDPSEPKTGKYLKRWRIRLNINPQELKASVWE